MDFFKALPNFQGNPETLVLLSAMHYAAAGKIDLNHLNAEELAAGLFSLIARLEAQHPGIAERYGWAKISDLQAFGAAIGDASKATRPDGLIS